VCRPRLPRSICTRVKNFSQSANLRLGSVAEHAPGTPQMARKPHGESQLSYIKAEAEMEASEKRATAAARMLDNPAALEL